jgi:hypothetical protein
MGRRKIILAPTNLAVPLGGFRYGEDPVPVNVNLPQPLPHPPYRPIFPTGTDENGYYIEPYDRGGKAEGEALPGYQSGALAAVADDTYENAELPTYRGMEEAAQQWRHYMDPRNTEKMSRKQAILKGTLFGLREALQGGPGAGIGGAITGAVTGAISPGTIATYRHRERAREAADRFQQEAQIASAEQTIENQKAIAYQRRAKVKQDALDLKYKLIKEENDRLEKEYATIGYYNPNDLKDAGSQSLKRRGALIGREFAPYDKRKGEKPVIRTEAGTGAILSVNPATSKVEKIWPGRPTGTYKGVELPYAQAVGLAQRDQEIAALAAQRGATEGRAGRTEARTVTEKTAERMNKAATIFGEMEQANQAFFAAQRQLEAEMAKDEEDRDDSLLAKLRKAREDALSLSKGKLAELSTGYKDLLRKSGIGTSGVPYAEFLDGGTPAVLPTRPITVW